MDALHSIWWTPFTLRGTTDGYFNCQTFDEYYNCRSLMRTSKKFRRWKFKYNLLEILTLQASEESIKLIPY